MMTLRQFYLTKLIEECAEVAQRAAKQMQFGAEEIQKEQLLTNRKRLSDELDDLLSTMDVLQEMNEVDVTPHWEFIQIMNAKQEKIKKYLKYSQELGMVGND